MVVTSRPSGIVDVSQYVDKFVIMNLLPLSSEQQRRIIEVQMKGHEFLDSLFATRWELQQQARQKHYDSYFASFHFCFPTLFLIATSASAWMPCMTRS